MDQWINCLRFSNFLNLCSDISAWHLKVKSERSVWIVMSINPKTMLNFLDRTYLEATVQGCNTIALCCYRDSVSSVVWRYLLAHGWDYKDFKTIDRTLCFKTKKFCLKQWLLCKSVLPGMVPKFREWKYGSQGSIRCHGWEVDSNIF